MAGRVAAVARGAVAGIVEQAGKATRRVAGAGRMALAAPRSGTARARILAGVARLNGRRPMVLQACCAGLMQDLRGKRVLLAGPHARRLGPVFAFLGARVHGSDDEGAQAFDLVFCAGDGEVRPEGLARLWRRVAPGGWLHCAAPPGGRLPDGRSVAALLGADPVLEAATDTLLWRLPDGGMLHPDWFRVGPGAPPVRVLVFRRPVAGGSAAGRAAAAGRVRGG